MHLISARAAFRVCTLLFFMIMAAIHNFVERSEKISQLNGRPDRLSADHMRASRHWGWAVPLCGLLLLLLSMATPGCLALSQDFSARLVREKLPSVEKDYPGFSEMMKMCAEKFEGNKERLMLGDGVTFQCDRSDSAEKSICYYSDIRQENSDELTSLLTFGVADRPMFIAIVPVVHRSRSSL
eukprot:GHVS01002626.1.p1 GENE.GHVS01002626.1~~GHVS01002626.1.p1  ORF type:complete len:183 (+),score=6.73 GHVS01002626.1:231-779(+)